MNHAFRLTKFSILPDFLLRIRFFDPNSLGSIFNGHRLVEDIVSCLANFIGSRFCSAIISAKFACYDLGLNQYTNLKPFPYVIIFLHSWFHEMLTKLLNKLGSIHVLEIRYFLAYHLLFANENIILGKKS